MKLRKEQYKINFVNFWDELTFPTMNAAEKFADCLIEEGLGLYWIASVRSELLKGEQGTKVARKLKESGCHGLAFSLESGSPKILKAMNKKNSVEDFIQQCGILREADIDVYTSIIVGFPQETAETLDKTFEVLERVEVYPSVGFLQVLPGTPLYADALAEGIFEEENYLHGMGDRQDLRINLTECNDTFLINYTTEKLIALNRRLNMGLDESSLIKTKVWSGSGKKKKAQ